MVNFRAKESELALIDKYAQLEGITRSDWIRNAINSVLKQSGNAVAVTERSAPTAKKELSTDGPQCILGTPTNCPSAQWVRLATGIRQCTTCGVKRA